jgi:hypothetical protein
MSCAHLDAIGQQRAIVQVVKLGSADSEQLGGAADIESFRGA